MKNYFQVLGLDVGASDADIKAAYRRLARTCHPDLCGPASADRFAELGEAYRFLSDRLKRAALEHDLLASAKTAEPAARPAKRPEPAARPEPRAQTRSESDARMDMLEAQLDAYERLLTELAPSLPARAYPHSSAATAPLAAADRVRGGEGLLLPPRPCLCPPPRLPVRTPTFSPPAARINCPKKIF